MPGKDIQILHLKKDKVLKKVIDRVGTIESKKNSDIYFSLLKSIVSQQLSIKAAATIWQRFIALFDDEYPHAEILIDFKEDHLRAAGLSYQKAGYIKNIAQFSLEKSLDYKHLKNKSDEALIEYLTEIKGVGRWTVEMILMFNLQRNDVFPKDDLGIQNGIIKLYNLQYTSKKELYAKMESLSQNWRPYRTTACKYIWRYKDAW